ncbi:MAG: TIGR04149 family rSAM-modified RiPP [Prevotellaceae bacterium]|jgi:natural product precursor|nr:TIGR04149 family rSAM-modified RiPP [Prevotellaceae bacterium]
MKKINLNVLAKNTMKEKEINHVKGGYNDDCLDACCGCGCAYANNGGSSIAANRDANAAGGLFTPGDPEAWQDEVCCD